VSATEADREQRGGATERHVGLRRRIKHEEAGLTLPLVALLDVIFFMLLYFMAAGTLTPPENELPSTITAEKRGPGAGTSDFTTQVLRVEARPNPAGGPATVSFRVGERVAASAPELLAVLTALPKGPGIIVKVADEATVDAAAAALQVVQDAGFYKVSYVAGP
jgi:biopolymer transport protein ExbD